MSKKITIIISFITLIFVLVALFLVFNFINNKTKKIAENNQTKKEQGESVSDKKDEMQTEATSTQKKYIEDTKKIIKELLDKSAKNIPKNITEVYSTVDKCNTIKDLGEKERCIILWAEHSMDKSFCDRIKSDLKNECIARVQMLKAEKEKNISSCSEISNKGYRNECIVRVVEASGNSDFNCQELSSEDQKICQIFKETKGKGSVEECELIKDLEIKNICLDNFYANLDK